MSRRHTGTVRCSCCTLRVLWQIIGNVVVIAFEADPVMRRQGHVACGLKSAHRNHHRLRRIATPKESRTAKAAKPARGICAGTIPRQAVIPVKGQRRPRCWQGCEMVTRLLAALDAMAGDRRAERRIVAKTDSTAQARSLMHGQTLCGTEALPRATPYIMKQAESPRRSQILNTAPSAARPSPAPRAV